MRENAGLAFIGEKPWPTAQLTSRQAKSLEASPNSTGRPNADVLRRFITVKSGAVKEQTRIDFPLHFTPQEAALYGKPFDHLNSALESSQETDRLNPYANAELRNALARLDRYLATPITEEKPAWNWIDSNLLPEATLLAVARDDDFTHGLLQSRLFDLWWRRHSSYLPPMDIVTSFPFPWPPATLLSSLRRDQEENRHAVARAVRAGAQEQLDSAVAALYGWPTDLAEEAVLVSLIDLNRQRAS